MADGDPSNAVSARETAPGSAVDAKPPATPEPVSLGGGPSPEVVQTFGLSRGDVRFALWCGAVILLLLVAHWVQRAWNGARLVEIDRLPSKAYEFRLDINSAT
jgi:hypothetical protein